MDEGFDGMVKFFSNALKAMAAEAAAAELGKLLFGTVGGNIGGGGLLNQFLGDGMGKLFGFGGFRATGGSVQTGKSYVVGEKEPELFIPSVSGFITTLSKLGSSKNTTIVINNNIQTPNAESFMRAEGNLTARIKMQLDRAGRRNL
jgi:phage-related minor tail protein